MQNPKHQTQILHRYLQLLNQPDKEMRFSVENGQLLKHLITVLCTEGVNKHPSGNHTLKLKPQERSYSPFQSMIQKCQRTYCWNYNIAYDQVRGKYRKKMESKHLEGVYAVTKTYFVNKTYPDFHRIWAYVTNYRFQY